MAITPLPPPDEMIQAVSNELHALNTASQALDRGQDDQGGAAGIPAKSLPIFGLKADDLREIAPQDDPRGNILAEKAQELGWRFLVHESGGTASLVDCSPPQEQGGKPSSMVIRGPSVERFQLAVEKATEKTPEGLKLEPRVLDFGPLGMTELWLHGIPEVEDLFYSLGKADSDASPRKASEVLEEAMERLRQQAVYPAPGDNAIDDDLGG
ncbi:hypothetical protein RQ734_19185 [Roseomonas mucosa]|uniref:hypothetical protein n=1 Tax=Roseomonas mucosa TaxID=207340 RepID=UPI0028CCA78A|nr:hypothetical protein [Roseomonas mucosa]MDT8278196.1 hypothetical protein [Roseomonas mucosa]MDT8354032.1 hypothetical protein [Roseomonas mucosa]